MYAQYTHHVQHITPLTEKKMTDCMRDGKNNIYCHKAERNCKKYRLPRERERERERERGRIITRGARTRTPGQKVS